MKKENKLIFITSLTLLLYALIILFDKGVFLFPFPLNEIIILIIALQFAYWNFKKYKVVSLILIIIGLLSSLSNEYYWSILFNFEKMSQFSNTIITDVFELIKSISIIILSIIFGRKQKNNLNYILSILFCFTFIIGIIISDYLYSSIIICFSYLIMIFSIKIKSVYKPINVFWILLLILESTKLLSISMSK